MARAASVRATVAVREAPAAAAATDDQSSAVSVGVVTR